MTSDSKILLLGIYTSVMPVQEQKDLCIQMSSAIIFVIKKHSEWLKVHTLKCVN